MNDAVVHVVGIALGLGLCVGAPSDKPAPIEIPDDTRISLQAGEVHYRDCELAAGDFLHLVVEQQAVDLAVRLLAPDGGELVRVDGPTGRHGSEELVMVVPAAGRYRVEVAAAGGEDEWGHYTFTRAAQRPATAEDRELVAADDAYRAARQLIKDKAARQAIDELLPVLATWRRLRLRHREADALDQLCRAYREAGRLGPAIEHGEKALVLHRGLGDERKLAVALQRAGLIYLALGDFERAEERLQEALPLFEEQGNERGVAVVLSRLGSANHHLGRIRRALGYFDQALALARAIERPNLEASILTDRAGILLTLDRAQEAIDALAAAQGIYQRLDRPKEFALATKSVADAFLRLGDPERAEEWAREAVKTLYGSEDLRSRALALITLGHVRRLRADHGGARTAYENAVKLARRSADARSEAVALTGLGHVEVEAGNPRRGLELHDRALALSIEIGEPKRLATSRVRGAQALRDLGRIEEAWQRLTPALDEVEQLRSATPRRRYRLSYFAFRQEYYEIAFDVLMELHSRQPAAGYDAVAFGLNERRLAREVLDRLAVSRSRLTAGEAGLEPVDLATVQQTLGDADSLLLVYALGEERSYLWAITVEGREAHVLPARRQLEARARAFAEALRWLPKRSQPERARRGRELGAVLLTPVAELVAARRRLIVVADGELQTIPFAALPPPGAGDEEVFLIESHEIVTLPSLSTLAARRRLGAALPPAQGRLAIFADPVFARDDPRVVGAGGGHSVAGGDLPRAEPLRRLVRSRGEAAAIRRIAGGDGHLLALDFTASREAFLSADLKHYDVLHFATHALPDPDPELSGLVLSLVDERGRPRDGFLRTHEIAALDLPVELVVLSACQSGVGRKIGGEGMLGLAWGFLNAGAARVIASLWPVSDRRTARLMTAFYTAYLKERMAPAAALRRAQQELLRDPEARPADWAGFVFQGDWRRPH